MKKFEVIMSTVTIITKFTRNAQTKVEYTVYRKIKILIMFLHRYRNWFPGREYVNSYLISERKRLISMLKWLTVFV